MISTADPAAGHRLLQETHDLVVHREVPRRSGGTCAFYVNGRRLALSPAVLRIAGPELAGLARRWGATHVGGEPAASLPIVGAAMVADTQPPGLGGCYFREAVKPTGITNMIEGNLGDSARIVFVDDVIGLGSVATRCIELAASQGHTVVGAFALAARDGGTGMRRIERLGIPTASLLDVDQDGNVTLGSVFR